MKPTSLRTRSVFKNALLAAPETCYSPALEIAKSYNFLQLQHSICPKDKESAAAPTKTVYGNTARRGGEKRRSISGKGEAAKR